MKFVKLNEVDPSSFDLVILGFGPAGISAAVEGSRRKLRVLVLVCDEDKTYPIETWNAHKFVQSFPGIGGQANLWGKQIAFPDHNQLSVLSCALGADKNFEQQLAKELYQLSLELDLEANQENEYEFEKMFFVESFKLKYSTYLNADSLLGIYKEDLGDVYVISDIRIFAIEKIAIEPFLVTSQGKIKFRADARLLIALGAINSTVLLMNSNLNRSNELGKNLQEHPHGYLFLINSLGKTGLKGVPTVKVNGHIYKRKLEYRNDDSNRTAIIEFHLDVDVAESKHLSFAYRMICTFVQKTFRTLNLLFLKVMNRLPFPGVKYKVWIQMNQAANPDNRLSCDGENVQVSWKLQDSDIFFLDEVKWALKNDFQRAGIKILKEFDFSGQSHFFATAFHPSGTIPANSDPKHGLVNEYGVLFENLNIGVASSAIWPVTGWFNPTITIMAFARILARKMLTP